MILILGECLIYFEYLMDPFHIFFEKLYQAEIYVQSELRSHDMISRMVCGGIAGVAAKTVIAPAERVKMGFQVSSETFSLEKALQRGKDIISKDGIFALWKGHSTTVFRVAPYAGITYMAHDYFEKELKYMYHTEILPFGFKFLAGSFGGVVGTLFTYPLDVLRIRLALTPGSTWLSTAMQGGLYQGISPTVLGIIPYSGTAWCVKQTLTEYFFPRLARKNSGHPSLPQALLINAIAGLVGQFVTYPLDIIRRRMQMFDKSTSIDKKVPNIKSMLAYLVKTEGYKGLSKGFTLNIIKGPITLSISLTTYDLLRGWVNGDLSDIDEHHS